MRKLNGKAQLNNVGIAGELRVMAELMMRGLNPAKSYLDNGFDIILEDGRKIQVKTARKHNDKSNGSNYYHFLTAPWGMKDRDKNRVRQKEVAYYICWCVEDDTFFVIPSDKLDGKTGVNLFPSIHRYVGHPRSEYEEFRNNWELLTG